MEATLLVELLTEELPPKSLAKLAEAFGWSLHADLKAGHFLADEATTSIYATPRRIAVSISNVRDAAPDFEVVVKGPAVKSGLDGAGNPTKALLGFANKRGVTVDKLVRINDGKQEVFAHRDLAKGGHLDTNLELKVEEALKRLPIPKMMRWGAGDAAFVRPAHGQDQAFLWHFQKGLVEFPDVDTGVLDESRHFIKQRLVFAQARAVVMRLRNQLSVDFGLSLREVRHHHALAKERGFIGIRACEGDLACAHEAVTAGNLARFDAEHRPGNRARSVQHHQAMNRPHELRIARAPAHHLWNRQTF